MFNSALSRTQKPLTKMRICKYYKKGMCHLGEMENCQKIGDKELDNKVNDCPFHPAYDNYCFDNAMIGK